MHIQSVRLGLRANWRQFTLLVFINGFVGAMVGLERTVVPLIAKMDFGLAFFRFLRGRDAPLCSTRSRDQFPSLGFPTFSFLS
ncbi:hypothetical protein IIA15_02315 [candidate division TA06 bacterium]|nr:hypothetical protein [candidate division TA06 bacterium]